MALFGSKEALFREAVELYRQTDGGAARQALQNAPSARDAMQDMLLAAAERFTTPGLPPGCMIVLARRRARSARPASASSCVKAGARCRPASWRAAEQGAAGGELPDDADLKGLAAFYTTVLHGMSIQARDGASRKTLQAVAQTGVLLTRWPASRLRTTPPIEERRHDPHRPRRLILWISLLSIMLVLAGGLHASISAARPAAA